jgi:hypothetical protein
VKIRFMAPSVSIVGRDRLPECDMGRVRLRSTERGKRMG